VAGSYPIAFSNYFLKADFVNRSFIATAMPSPVGGITKTLLRPFKGL
jgi:hypothetical protein